MTSPCGGNEFIKVSPAALAWRAMDWHPGDDGCRRSRPRAAWPRCRSPSPPARRSNRRVSEATYQPSPRPMRHLRDALHVFLPRAVFVAPVGRSQYSRYHVAAWRMLWYETYLSVSQGTTKKVGGERRSGRLMLGKEQHIWRGFRPVLGQVPGHRPPGNQPIWTGEICTSACFSLAPGRKVGILSLLPGRPVTGAPRRSWSRIVVTPAV